MSYKNLQEMSPISLEKILLVMDDFRSKFELKDKLTNLDVGAEAGIQGVTEDDFIDIIIYLKKVKIINHPWFINIFLTRHQRRFSVSNKKRFLNFYKKVNDEIQRRKPLKEPEKSVSLLKFDELKSILTIQNYKILIARRKEKTDEDEILKELFKNENMECYYAELAESISGLDYQTYKSDQKYWQKYYGACERIQQKVTKKTENVIKDFLDFNSGIKGSVKINKKYIPKDLLNTHEISQDNIASASS